ncbi:MAG: MFS transporter [Oscillospiraceae bacterium]|nr:MFS transporter [Oscillospiraceae bacterium]
MTKEKLTKLEKYWILYDVANSAFILLVATIVPIYFNSLAESAGISEVDYLAYWGYAASVATLIVALIGPVLGTMADMNGFKKPIFTICMMIGVLGCAALSFPSSWVIFLAVFVLAKVGFSASLIFYDSMLSDVTEPERMDKVSSYGYAWGYIGSCVPFVISLGIVLGHQTLGISMTVAMGIAFFLNAAWWLLLTLPLLRHYKPVHSMPYREHAVRKAFGTLYHTFREIKSQKHIFLFLLAFFFFIDGVYTIIDMATAFGSALGFDSTMLLLALLLTQIVAFPFALIFGKAAKKYRNDVLIKICIVAYTAIALFAIQLDKPWEFWLLAGCVGMFQGGIQALSRSYFAKIIPPEKSGEYFGLFDICGKGASFMGTALVGLFTQMTGSTNLGISILAAIFVVGLLLFHYAAKQNPVKQ